MSDEFRWDVFLSHSSRDKPRVARLAQRLEQAGLRVWFDNQDIDGGQDIVAAIEDGLQQSRVLLLCMTQSAFDSEWVRLERNTATFRDPGNHARRFLPVRFEECVIPATLRRLKYIDWSDESEQAWQELLARLQPGAEPLPELPADLWNPFDPYTPALGSGFVGRAEELRRLQQAMETGHSASVVCDKAGSFFRDCLQPRGARFDVRAAIEQIVAGQTPELTANQTRFLIGRGLITADGRLAFQILARWLNEFAE